MNSETTYYKIQDLNMLGKINNDIPYIYKDKQWIVDNDDIIMDRIIGYEPNEGIGNTDMLDRIAEITREEAEELTIKMK